MKTKLWKTTEKEVYIDVEFPVYRKDDVTGDEGPSSVLYAKIIPGGKRRVGTGASLVEFSVHLRGDDGAEVSIDRDYQFGKDTMDYNLGHGMYASSEHEFQEAVRQAKHLLSEIERFHQDLPQEPAP